MRDRGRKAADLIATERNPLVDITELERVAFVMREGVIHRPGPADAAEAVSRGPRATRIVTAADPPVFLWRPNG